MTARTPPRPVNPAALPTFTPVARKHRHDGWTQERQRDFIAALAETGSVKHAAARIGMSCDGAYQLRRLKGAESFAAAWVAALDLGVQRLEDIALERAIHGVETPVYSYGKLVGTRIVHNDRLLMFMLRNRAADRYPTGAARAAAMTEKQIQELKAEWMREMHAPNGEAAQRFNKFLDEIRRRRAAEEASNRADPLGPITIQGQERAAFERWRAGEQRALAAPDRDAGADEQLPRTRQL